MSNLRLDGFNEFQKDLIKVISKKYPEEAKKFMKKQANDVKKTAIEMSEGYQDEGMLKKSWKTSSKGKKKASMNFIEATVTNDAPHSHLVESGHIIANQHGEYGFWAGVHMLERAVAEKENEFTNELDNFLDRALGELKL